MVLAFDVLLDDVIGHISAAAAEIAPCPEVPSPVCLARMGVLAEQLVGSFPFEPLHEPTDCDVRRDRNEQVDVIARNMPLDDIHILTLADLPDHIPNSKCNRPLQYLLSVLRDPYQVEMNRKNRV